MNIELFHMKDIPEVLRLISSIFPRDMEHVKATLHAYQQGEKDLHWIEHALTDLRFWTIHKDTKIVGTIGIYEKSMDKNEACWISWFCVAPQVRRQGIGTKLLDYVIGQAKIRNKRFLRLYISDAPEEKNAQLLYAKYGFRETYREPESGTRYQRIYRELSL